MTSARLIATVGGVGLLRPAPGTWGSALALGLAYALALLGEASALLAAILLISALGLWAADAHARQSGREDAGEIVIDEVAGQWIAALPLAYGGPWWGWLLAFGLFRLFDIAKPWPVGWADRRVKGGLGVMLDDWLAGALAAAVLWTLLVMTGRG